jgi:hypothetical protein
MRNAGTTTWDAAAGHGLGSATPEAGAWGITQVAVPRIVHVGEEVTFSFTVTAPQAIGNHEFQWQMNRSGAWFGDATEPLTVAVAGTGEPPQCDTIRTEINDIDARIRSLQDRLVDDPRRDAPILRQINELRRRRGELVANAQALGCAV